MDTEQVFAGDTTDCQSEEGITVSLIDTISFLLGQLADRDLGSENVQHAIKDMQINGKFSTCEKIYTLFISQRTKS